MRDYTVELKVGTEQHSIFAHASLLSSNSDFFEAALKKEWEEGQKRTVGLPEEHYELVYTYVRWVYAGKIYTISREPNGEPLFENLIKLYVLGEKLIDDAFQDSVLNSIVSMSREEHGLKRTRIFPGPDLVITLYNGTPPSSPARKLLAHMFVSRARSDWMESKDDMGRWDVPEAFKDDVVAAFVRLFAAGRFAFNIFPSLDHGIPCEYHKHDKDSPCPFEEG